MALHNEIGKVGENIAAHWLKNRGMAVIDRNFRKKFGEIDIVSRETDGKIHFIEVKTVSYGTKTDLEWAVSHETWRPEEMVHRHKQVKFLRTIEVWLLEHPSVEGYQIDVITVRLVPREKYAQVKYFKNLIFEV